MKKVVRVLALLLFVLLFVGTIFFIYNKSKTVAVVYETESAFKTDITRKIVATGTIVPEKEVAVKAQVSGLLSEIYVEAGDYVKKGEAIAKIAIVPNMISLNEAESRVRRSKIQLENAKQDFDRNKELFEGKIITDEEFQRYQVALKSAEEEVAAATDNVSLIKKGVAQGKSGNTIIRSTIDGMVLAIPLKEGNSVIESNTFNDGTTVASVADVSKMIFEGVIDESDVNKLKMGMPMRLTIGAIENESFDANITFISPKGVEDQGAIQFDIKGTVKLKEGVFIRAGYSANANIIIEEVKDVLSINEGLLQFDDQGTFVEIEGQKPQEFDKVYLETGLSDGINIQVLNGIDESSKIKKWDVQTSYGRP